MSTPGGTPPSDPSSDQSGQPTPWMPPNARSTPNAERYLLEADALRRRQLRSALLHGSSRTWREQRRIWPAVVAGIVLVAVILATFKVIQAVKEDNPATQTVPGTPASSSVLPQTTDLVPTGSSEPTSPPSSPTVPTSPSSSPTSGGATLSSATTGRR